MLIHDFASFVMAVPHYQGNAPKDWRAGQCAFNLLSHVRPELAFMVQASDFDPFQNDAKLPLFYDFVMRHWND